MSLVNEVYGSAYRAIVGAHKSMADQFWLIVVEIVALVICCVLYLSQASQALPVVPVIPVLQSLAFYGIAVLALITILLIIRLHLRIRYENALLAQQQGY